jgi:hypothetical protein
MFTVDELKLIRANMTWGDQAYGKEQAGDDSDGSTGREPGPYFARYSDLAAFCSAWSIGPEEAQRMPLDMVEAFVRQKDREARAMRRHRKR